jgi:hypothetical protein
MGLRNSLLGRLSIRPIGQIEEVGFQIKKLIAAYKELLIKVVIDVYVGNTFCGALQTAKYL